MKYLWLPLALALPFAATQCNKIENATEKVASADEQALAKSTFEGLTRGDSAVAKSIDWPVLQSLGENVGAAYVQIPSETEKVNFQQAFVTQFASSFQKAGGSAADFTNWRTSFHDATKTEVAADAAQGTVTIVVTKRDGVDRVSSLGFLVTPK